MKHLLIVFFPFLFIFKIYGQPVIEAESRLAAVTVYPEQAQLEYTGVLTLLAGESRVVFTKLSPGVLNKSIQLNLSEPGIRIESVSTKANFLSKKKVDEHLNALQQ